MFYGMPPLPIAVLCFTVSGHDAMLPRHALGGMHYVWPPADLAEK